MALPLLTQCIYVHCVCVFDVQGCPTPLVVAVSSGGRDVAELLVAHGADVNAESGVGGIFAVDGSPSLPVVTRVVCVFGVQGDLYVSAVQVRAGSTPLTGAAEGGHCDSVDMLVAHGADVNGRNGVSDIFAVDLPPPPVACSHCVFGGQFGLTALMCAAGRGDAAELLVAHGAEVAAKDNVMSTSLSKTLAAALCGLTQCVVWQNGATALSIALMAAPISVFGSEQGPALEFLLRWRAAQDASEVY